MRRDPLSIISILIQTLESLNENKIYNINEISTISSLHWETCKKYINLIRYIQNLAPVISLNNNEVKIVNKASYQNLKPEKKVLLFLFYSKAFNDKSAIELLEDHRKQINILIEQNYIERTPDNRFFLKKTGKISSHRIYKEIRDQIYSEYVNLQESMEFEDSNSHREIEKIWEKISEDLAKKFGNKFKELESKIDELKLINIDKPIKSSNKKLKVIDNAQSSNNRSENNELFINNYT